MAYNFFSRLACKFSCLPRIYRISTSHVSCQNIILHFNEKGIRGKLEEDPIITQLRVEDEKILEEMENAGTDFEKYDGLVTERHKLYLEHEKRATNDTTRYLISTLRQNILTQIRVSVLEAELIKLTIRVDNLETKT